MKPNSGNDIWHYVAQFHCWEAQSVTRLQLNYNVWKTQKKVSDTYYNMNKIYVMSDICRRVQKTYL